MRDQEPPQVAKGRVGRVAPLVGLAGRTAGEAVVASLRNRRRDDHQAHQARVEFHTRTATHWARQLGRSRGVLMKAGQILSVIMPDTVVENDYRGIYQAAFARLRDDATPMPGELAADIIATELGRPVAELFAQFEPVPIAAASIGQVHAATMPDGRRVAVKVQYPGVAQAIRADLANTELLATFLQLLFTMVPTRLGRLDTAAMGREISDRIGEEIDYRVEAANQQAFADAYRGHPFIRIPEVVPERCTGRVLTMEFVDGLRFAKAVRAEQRLRDLWGEAIFRFGQDGAYNHRLVNADPHPGNFLFHPDGTVTFLDFGCVKRLSPDQARTTSGLVQRTVAQDPHELHRWAISSGWITPPDVPTPAELLQWWSDGLRYLVAPQPFTFTPEYIVEVTRNRLSTSNSINAAQQKLTVPAEMTLVVRMDTAVTAALGALRATGPWNAIREEIVDDAPPTTPYGEQ
ncbi:MAG TPA: AarF/ABC1/UbiB kinase family protein, partial [Pseudonocardia sp.]